MAGRRTAEALKAKGYNRFVFSLATGIATAAFSIKRWPHAGVVMARR
jgi:hypothetical protein